MATYTQGARVGELKTPLGQDKLVLTRLSGTEGVSELFEFRVECVNEKDGRDDYVDFDPALGKTATVAIETINQGKRYFAGTVTEAQRLRETATDVHYVMVLRPWLWALSRKINSLIFHEMTAPDIIAKIFGEHGSLADYDNQLKKDYPTLEYCVQHRESDMNFVCRLMEAHGISYHFKFGDNQQTLVMGDETSSYADAPGTTRKFYPIAAQHQRKEEHFFEWMPERRFTTGKTMRNDYDFEKPTANLKGEKAGDAQYANGQLEDYGHPYHSHVGKDVKQDDGQAYAEAALNMALAEDKRALASGDCLSLAAGMRMRLANHDNAAENQEYLVLRCAHDFFENAYRSGQGTDDPYRGSFELLPTAQNFAPPMVTPKPFIAGPQTAKVVGDGEIDTDKYGRIKVHFHWDRKSEDEPDGRSMWCRVAQVWAGAKWGGIFIPRKDMEVLVHFIDGDPDRPVIIGSLYNADNMPPYALPKNKNVAGWMSHSTEGGGEEDYNEFVMDDTRKEELVRLHAQKDLLSEVENDEKREIGHDRETKIGNNDTLDVTNEILIKAGMKITITVGESTIVMDPFSISIASPKISIDGKMLLQTHSGTLAEHKSDGMLMINAALVKIN